MVVKNRCGLVHGSGGFFVSQNCRRSGARGLAGKLAKIRIGILAEVVSAEKSRHSVAR
jgi:hypothetical protein